MSGKNGDMPVAWAAATLGDVLEVIRGVTYRKEESSKTPAAGLIPLLRANNIQDDVVFDDFVFVPSACVSAVQMLRCGDIVVAASSGSASLVGKAAQLKHDWRGTFGAFCFGLRPVSNMDPRFIGWFLHSKEYRNRVTKASAGININNLRAEHIEATPFRIPPIEEQIRIADTLDELLSDLDAGVAALARVRAKLKQYRAAVLKAAVEGALTAEWRAKHPASEPATELLQRILTERRRRWEADQLQKFKAAGKPPPKDWKARYKPPVAPNATGLPPLPMGWCWATASQLAWTSSYGTSEKCSESNSGLAVLRIPNIIGGRLNVSELKHAQPDYTERDADLIGIGDILIVRTNGSRTLIGRGAVVRELLKDRFSFASYLIRLRLVPRPPLLGWIAALWESPFVRQWIEARAATSAGQYNVSLGVLETLVLPLPPENEQAAIVEAVEDQLSVIDHVESDLETRLRSATALRQSILRHAFTGQLVPQDPSDEPASELLKRIAIEREARERNGKTPHKKASRKAAKPQRGKKK